MSEVKKVEQTSLPRRFYKGVSIGETSGADGSARWQLLLDGRAVKTPGKTTIAVRSADLAEEIAEEWRAQDERIDPATMPITRIVNSAIDGVSGREVEVAADIAAFAGSDLVCYRAEGPEDLIQSQVRAWDPMLAWAREAFGARFMLGQGVMPVEQPAEALRAFANEISELDALQLGALHVMTTLTGSAVIALAHARGVITADEAWAAAHVDEDFQISQWGDDEEAAERREKRWAEFQAASKVWRLNG